MAMQPIKRYGGFTATGVDQSGVKRMQALAGFAGDVLETTSRIGRTVAEAEAPAKAEAAVAKAREEGTEIEMKSPLAWGGSTYNRVAQAAYESNLKVDIDEAMYKASQEHPDDLIAYQQLVDASTQGLTANAPEAVRARLGAFSRQHNSKYTRKINAEAKRNIDAKLRGDLEAGLEVSKDNISNLSRSGNAEALQEARLEVFFDLENAVQSGVVTSTFAEQQKAIIDDDVAIQTQLGRLDATIFSDDLTPEERIAKGAEFVDSLRKADIPELSATQKDALVQRVSGIVASETVALNKAKTAVTHAEAEQLSNLEISIDNSQGTQEENEIHLAAINSWWQSGKLSQAKRTELINGVIKQTATEITKQQNLQLVGGVISGDVDRLSNPISETATNQYYNTLVSPGLSADPISRAAQQAQYVKDTFTVPTQLKQEIEANLMSGDADRILAASETIYRLRAIPGIGQKLANPNQLAFAKKVGELSGIYGPDEAIKRALKATDPLDQVRIEAAEAFLKEEDYEYSEEIADAFGGFIFDLPTNTVGFGELAQDYKSIVETNYAAGMTIEDAKADAVEYLQANWSNGEFGLMKFAPEQYYGVGDSDTVAYIRDEIYNDLTGPTGIVGLDVTKENIYLISDQITARQAASNNGRPTYLVMVKDANGLLTNISIDGNTRYTPGVESEQERQIAAEKEERLQRQRLEKSAEAARYKPSYL
jgi:hypothetical protein